MSDAPSAGELGLFALKVWQYKQGELVSLLLHLGDRVGLFAAMADDQPVTSKQLAAKTGLAERWVREWLLGMAAADIVDSADGRTFSLGPAAAEVLTASETSLFHAGGALTAPFSPDVVEGLAEAFHTGVGLSYDRLGVAGAHSVARSSGPWTRLGLVPMLLPRIDGLADRLKNGAQVADVGCGAAGALIVLAEVFPASTFTGYDPSLHAIELGRKNIADEGLGNVTLVHDTADALPKDRSLDLVLTFDCLHDMPHPDRTLAQIRDGIADDGVLLIKEIRSADTFAENRKNPVLALMYGFSVSTCMSSATSEPDGLGLGTLGLPPSKLEAMVRDAGFTRFTVHDIGEPTNLAYEVRP